MQSSLLDYAATSSSPKEQPKATSSPPKEQHLVTAKHPKDSTLTTYDHTNGAAKAMRISSHIDSCEDVHAQGKT
jgi:hypothetical protein